MIATEFVIVDVTGGGRTEVARTSDRTVTLTGLAGVERTYEVVSINAIGLPSDASPPVSVTPLSPNQIFVAPFGDDTSPTAGTPATPFQTLHAALARARTAMADEIVLHDGSYNEPAALDVPFAIVLHGGMHASGGTWTDDGGTSTVTIAGGRMVPSCSTGQFNRAGRDVFAALLVDGTGGAAADRERRYRRRTRRCPRSARGLRYAQRRARAP